MMGGNGQGEIHDYCVIDPQWSSLNADIYLSAYLCSADELDKFPKCCLYVFHICLLYT